MIRLRVREEGRACQRATGVRETVQFEMRGTSHGAIAARVWNGGEVVSLSFKIIYV